MIEKSAAVQEQEQESDAIQAYARQACGAYWDNGEYDVMAKDAALLVARRALADIEQIKREFARRMD